MDTRIIGIDLAVKGAHKAVVLDQASNTFVSPLHVLCPVLAIRSVKVQPLDKN